MWTVTHKKELSEDQICRTLDLHETYQKDEESSELLLLDLSSSVTPWSLTGINITRYFITTVSVSLSNAVLYAITHSDSQCGLQTDRWGLSMKEPLTEAYG